MSQRFIGSTVGGRGRPRTKKPPVVPKKKTVDTSKVLKPPRSSSTHASTIARAVADNSKRLGISWSLRPATVTSVTAGGQMFVQFDGDRAVLRVASLAGDIAPGQRVMVMTVPPSGNFVIGQTSPLPVLRGQTGSESVSFTSQTSDTVSVTFPIPFGSVPVVTTNIDNGTGSTSGWGSRAFNITTTGFTLFVFGTVSTWASVTVQWAAFDLTVASL